MVNCGTLAMSSVTLVRPLTVEVGLAASKRISSPTSAE